MFAIIKSGGKQYKITAGDILKLEYLGLKKGEYVSFDQVLMLKNDKAIEIGSPLIANALVQGKILENKNDQKVLIFKKRRRHNSRRLNGHKRKLSVVRIHEISYNGKSIAKFQEDSKTTNKDTKDKEKSKKNIEKKNNKKVTKDGN